MNEEELLRKQEMEDMHEQIEDEISAVWGSGAVSFEQLEQVGKAREYYEDVRALTTVAMVLLDNISWRFTPDGDNRENISLIKELVKDYTDRLDALTAEVQTPEQKSLADKTRDFISKALGILNKDPDNETKEQNFKTEGGVKYYASDYLYVPDKSKPSTWKLRISEGGTGKVTVAQLGRAAAAFSKGGFRGNRVQLPSGEVSKIKAKLRAKYRSLGVKEDDMPESIRKEAGEPQGSFTILKQADGSYRWIAIYSNNFEDLDEDILAKESHNRFVERIEKGEADYPELWHWHIPGTAWGKADMIAFDNETGMAVASGYVLKGHEAEAEALADAPFAVGVSHGMPRSSVVRDPRNPHVITDYTTQEISDLPLVKAANRLTHFVIHKEEVMPIPAAKKDYLKSVGVPDEVIDELEATMKKSSDEATKDGIVSKETEATTESVPQEVEAKTDDTTNTTAAEVGEQETDDKEAQAESSEEGENRALTKEDIAQAVAESLKPIVEGVNAVTAELRSKIETLEKELTQKKSDDETVRKQVELTPASSLAAMIAKSMTASESAETILRKNAAATKDAPEETPPLPQGTAVATQNPILNNVITKIIGGNNSAPTQ